MRKFICSVLVLVMLVTTGIPSAMAAHHGKKGKGQNQKCSNAKQNYSVCIGKGQKENCSNSSRKGLNCGQWIDENGDNICDNKDQKTTECENWVDEDEDGVCDRRVNKCNNNGTGQCKVNKNCRRK